MYLKKLKINNYRKFSTNDNLIEFVDAEAYENANNITNFNIATTTTLIVGKNNAGKTTIIHALNKIVNDPHIASSDFNYYYLKKIFNAYKQGNYSESPMITFEITVGLDKGLDDYVTNIAPFMVLEDIDASEIVVIVAFEIKDEVLFINKCKTLFDRGYNSDDIVFEKFLEIIDSTLFKPAYYNKSNVLAEHFKLADLIQVVMIKANNITDDECLSDTFNKIVKLRYQELFQQDKEELENNLLKINSKITKQIKKKHTKEINDTIRRIVTTNDIQVSLSADITFEKLMKSLIRYEYVENGNNIPENQFGLGYTNLMMIIARLIEYMEKYPKDSFNSRINLIAIEEPETYMHPQMQELFIKYINDAVSTLLSINKKNVNSQLIITTHSSHILNSKIQSGGSFNCINYITEQMGKSIVFPLNDEIIAPNGDTLSEAFTFIKKHIKFEFADLFFSDAIILVEGISEYTLLPYYISGHKVLRKKYISVLNINGAHGLVYENLIRFLKIPTLLITDLDIERSGQEKEAFQQIGKLMGRETTNKTIIHFWGTKDISYIPTCMVIDNIYIAYQGKVGYYYATSFEEAFIATNFSNKILNSVLKQLKPQIYKEIVGEPINYNNNKRFSYKWQKKLAEAKSGFANEVLYSILVHNENIPKLPKYISDGLNYLAEKID